MYKRRAIAFLLSVIILIMSISCSSKQKSENPQLTIYRLDSDFIISRGITAFNSINKDVEIKEKVYYYDQGLQYVNDLTGSLLAGQGPDIIVIPENMNRAYLGQLIAKGVFSDLNELIKEDKDFKLSDYNEKVLDGGMYKGNRFLMPVSFTIPAFVTVQEALDNNGITIDESQWNWKQLREIASKYLKNNKDKHLSGGFMLKDILENYPKPLVNYVENTASLTSDEFIKYMEEYKKSGFNKSINTNRGLTVNDNSNILFKGEYIRKLDYINSLFGDAGSKLTPRLYPIPSPDNQMHVTAKPNYMVAINNKCKNKKAAFEYIKVLLSRELQTDGYMFNLPVRKDALKQQENKALSSSLYINTSEFISQFDKLLNTISGCELFDKDLNQSINLSMEDALSNQQSLAEVIGSMQLEILEQLKNTVLPEYDINQTDANNGNTPKLKIYSMFWEDVSKNAIRAFKEKYKDVDIEGTEFTDLMNIKQSLQPSLCQVVGRT